MNTPFNKLAIAAATAGVLSLSMAGGAIAAPQNTQPPMAATGTVDKAQEAVSDTWITSKVKSTFVADKALSALDIKVETNQGVVSLSGVVGNDAERDLAIEKTKAIKGVTDVSADGLKATD
ncbi:BON domain-containing protein [Pseudomonas cavernae]|uniref:BON domain-containing protein n=1 Tax=Pseudomonas cavernae TaxID=2320867 RepID=A0A385Z193_9PSED|nr:BON domain-containing protein [Pseudomonas cavernae]AYC31658.1 BON domain-containing protein [Pseudomonas cavernae]